MAILGNFRTENDCILFEPLIPFTRGLQYEVIVMNKRVGEITIPAPQGDAVVTQVYPTTDTVPENLLKVYIQFSKPMREGVSAQHITLLKNNADTVHGAFLDLQPELWNDTRTMLTVWLDPGRIKRDLIPNRTLGTPLQKGEQYTLYIDSLWTDTQGASLEKTFTKKFIVTSRDSISPQPEQWLLNSPSSGTTDALHINFKASLDYSLLTSALQVQDDRHKIITGSWHTGEKEKSIRFTPAEEWKPGRYTLIIETRLEDLAGNNINRAFDVDINARKENISSESGIATLTFFIR